MKNLICPIIVLACVAALGAGCATTKNERATGPKLPQVVNSHQVLTGFLDKTMAVGGETRRYVLYVPRDYDAAKAWPVIVFLHGSGERGDDGLKQSETGIGAAIRTNPERFPCLVIMPQCPKSQLWQTRGEDIGTALKQTQEEYTTDSKRIYLTGLSMGGFGTWYFGARNVETYAALMPICGGGNVNDAPALAKLPIWAFHGEKDTVVQPKLSQAMVDAVKANGGDVQYTTFPDTGHDSWVKAYALEPAITWLLSQHK